MKTAFFASFFILVTIINQSVFSDDKTLITSGFKELTDTVKNAGKSPIGSCSGTEYNHATGLDEKVGMIYSSPIKKEIKLSVLSPKEAQKAFIIAKEDHLNDFSYPLDGCFARAHRTNFTLEKSGIISGKAFVEGELYIDTNLPNFPEIGWEYHTATFILVEEKLKDKKVAIPYIIDPVLFDKAVPYDQWKAVMTKSKKTKISSEFLTSRFTYDRFDKAEERKEWVYEEIEDSMMQIGNGRRMSDMLDINLTKNWYK